VALPPRAAPAGCHGANVTPPTRQHDGPAHRPGIPGIGREIGRRLVGAARRPRL